MVFQKVCPELALNTFETNPPCYWYFGRKAKGGLSLFTWQMKKYHKLNETVTFGKGSKYEKKMLKIEGVIRF